jgi:hypothetical protein
LGALGGEALTAGLLAMNPSRIASRKRAADDRVDVPNGRDREHRGGLGLSCAGTGHDASDRVPGDAALGWNSDRI